MISWSRDPSRGCVFLDVPADDLTDGGDGADIFVLQGGPMHPSIYVPGLRGSAAFADDLIARVEEAGVSRIGHLALVTGRVPDIEPGPFGQGRYLGEVPWHAHNLRRGQHWATAKLLRKSPERHVVRITEVGDRDGTIQALQRHHLPFPGVADLLDTLPVELTKGSFATAERLARILATHRTCSTIVGPSVPPSLPDSIDEIASGLEATTFGSGTPLAEVIDGAPDGVWAPPALAESLARHAPAGLAALLASITADPEAAGQPVSGVSSIRFLVQDGVEIVFDIRPYVLVVR